MDYQITLCRPSQEAISWELEREVWNPFNWQSEERTPSPPYDPDLHLVAISDRGLMIGTIDGCKIPWSGRVEDLPEGGWSGIAKLGAERRDGSNFACAIGASVTGSARSSGLAVELLSALLERARELELDGLLAPVLPSYRWMTVTTLSLSDYAELRLPDGRHFDPWVRSHERIGGEVIGVCEDSAKFVSPRADWERWFQMRLPDDGEIILPKTGLLRLRSGRGELRQESLWIHHRV